MTRRHVFADHWLKQNTWARFVSGTDQRGLPVTVAAAADAPPILVVTLSVEYERPDDKDAVGTTLHVASADARVAHLIDLVVTGPYQERDGALFIPYGIDLLPAS